MELMFAVLHTVAIAIANLFKSHRQFEAENVLLRHQLNIAMWQAPAHLRLRSIDRAILGWVVRVWPALLGAAGITWSVLARGRSFEVKTINNVAVQTA